MYMQRDALITHTAYGGAGMQRDLHIWKETYIYRKSVCKETYVYTKRPMYVQRDLCICKRDLCICKRDAHITHIAHGGACMQRDLCIHKETYVYAKETYVYAKEMRTSRTSLTDKLWTKNRER